MHPSIQELEGVIAALEWEIRKKRYKPAVVGTTWWFKSMLTYIFMFPFVAVGFSGLGYSTNFICYQLTHSLNSELLKILSMVSNFIIEDAKKNINKISRSVNLQVYVTLLTLMPVTILTAQQAKRMSRNLDYLSQFLVGSTRDFAKITDIANRYQITITAEDHVHVVLQRFKEKVAEIKRKLCREAYLECGEDPNKTLYGFFQPRASGCTLHILHTLPEDLNNYIGHYILLKLDTLELYYIHPGKIYEQVTILDNERFIAELAVINTNHKDKIYLSVAKVDRLIVNTTGHNRNKVIYNLTSDINNKIFSYAELSDPRP